MASLIHFAFNKILRYGEDCSGLTNMLVIENKLSNPQVNLSEKSQHLKNIDTLPLGG